MNLVSTVFYFGLAGATALCASQWQTMRKNGSIKLSYLFAAFTILIPTFFSAIRYGIGTDYQTFANYLKVINQHGKLPVLLEPGYVLLNLIVGGLHGDEHLLYGFCTAIGMIFLLLTLDRYRKVMSPAYGVLIYMLWYYQMSLNMIRQSLSIIIVLYDYRINSE